MLINFRAGQTWHILIYLKEYIFYILAKENDSLQMLHKHGKEHACVSKKTQKQEHVLIN